MRALALALVLGCGSSTDTGPARDTITASSLRADVELLASDEFLGRGTGEKGAELAADHIESVFASAGLQALPGQESLKVEYTLYQQGWAEGSRLDITAPGGTTHPALGQDFRPFPFSDTGAAEAELVFAGYGITAPELEHDDYADIDASGKVVVVLRHDPGEGTEDSPWKEHGGHALFTSKARNAADHGAIGLILVTDPLNHELADDLRAGGRLSLDNEPMRTQARSDGQPFLALQVSRGVGESLVASTGKDLAELQTALNAGEAVNGDLEGSRVRVAVRRESEPRPVRAHNVVGFLPGTDPERADEWVVIGAHYDHLGAFHGDGDTIFNGADDNASGTAGLLALARAFAAVGPLPRPVAFAAFSGEENGLLGSRALLADEVVDPEDVAFMLNLDMIGRADAGSVEVVGDGYGTGLREAVEAANADLDLKLEFAGTDYAGNSDHHPFKEADVPFLFLSTQLHDDYHQLSDHVEKLDIDQMTRVVQLGFIVVAQAARADLDPRFVHHIGWLGARVDLRDIDGTTRAVITSVESDSRGADAGLESGDLIYGFDDTKLDRARDVGEQFRAIEPGASVRLAVDRANSRRTFELERAKTGYLGVWPADLTDEFRSEHGLASEQGVLLRQVMAETPAAAAGLRDGDALISLQGVPTSLGTLSKTLTRIGAGETIPVTIIRDGERSERTMTLGERPERP